MLTTLLGFGALASTKALTNELLPSFHNFRDLGGTPCGASAQLKPNLFLRSASPADAEPADVDALTARLPELRVIDLRAPKDSLKDHGPRLLADRTSNVDLLTKRVGGKRIVRHLVTDRLYVTYPLLPIRLMRMLPSRRVRAYASERVDAGIRKFLETIELTDVYWWIVTEQGDVLCELLEDCTRACQAQVPTMIHCAHGKDRTGVFVALVLHICGVDANTIAEDYARSDDWGCSPEGQDVMLEAMPEQFRERIGRWAQGEDRGEGDATPWPQFVRWCGAEAPTMLALFKKIEKKWGSLDGYLDSIGMDATKRDELRAALTCPA